VSRYEQHCPVARAAEVVSEPWTLLVLRELLRGSERKVDIARGVPRMSESLLGTRLRTLTGLGLVTTVPGDARHGRRYRLTEAGRELRPVVDQLGRWGQRWLAAPRLGELDAELLLFDICREMSEDRLPDRPLTVEVDIADAPPPGRWWLALSSADARVCTTEPVEAVDVRLRCTLGALAGVWQGRQSWLRAVRDRAVVLVGQRTMVRSFVECVGVSRYAGAVDGGGQE
jgi:DNA-binding HxlR family transcriptional regulator